MKKRIFALVVALAMLLCETALGEGYRIQKKNQNNFGHLLIDLLHAYETPSPTDESTIAASLEAIRSVSESDYEVARAIADHWNKVYVNPDGSYQLYLYDGGERATALENTSLVDSPDHAFVVLGYELKNGEMADELIGRCDAAIAAARSFPSAIIVCTGGATGKNNPKKHTEAGLMKAYMAEHGIDASRIFTDDSAQNTLDNAVNTFKILRERQSKTITIITSSYHQLRGQTLYNAMSALYQQEYGFSVDSVENYSFDKQAPSGGKPEDRQAVRQLATMLKLPDRVVENMKKWF